MIQNPPPTSSIQQIRQNINFDKILNVPLTLHTHIYRFLYFSVVYYIMEKPQAFWQYKREYISNIICFSSFHISLIFIHRGKFFLSFSISSHLIQMNINILQKYIYEINRFSNYWLQQR